MRPDHDGSSHGPGAPDDERRTVGFGGVAERPADRRLLLLGSDRTAVLGDRLEDGVHVGHFHEEARVVRVSAVLVGDRHRTGGSATPGPGCPGVDRVQQGRDPVECTPTRLGRRGRGAVDRCRVDGGDPAAAGWRGGDGCRSPNAYPRRRPGDARMGTGECSSADRPGSIVRPSTSRRRAGQVAERCSGAAARSARRVRPTGRRDTSNDRRPGGRHGFHPPGRATEAAFLATRRRVAWRASWEHSDGTPRGASNRSRPSRRRDRAARPPIPSGRRTAAGRSDPARSR